MHLSTKNDEHIFLFLPTDKQAVAGMSETGAMGSVTAWGPSRGPREHATGVHRTVATAASSSQGLC